MGQRIDITVEVEQDDWRKVRRFLKTLLRSFGIRCVGLNLSLERRLLDNELTQVNSYNNLEPNAVPSLLQPTSYIDIRSSQLGNLKGSVADTVPKPKGTSSVAVPSKSSNAALPVSENGDIVSPLVEKGNTLLPLKSIGTAPIDIVAPDSSSCSKVATCGKVENLPPSESDHA